MWKEQATPNPRKDTSSQTMTLIFNSSLFKLLQVALTISSLFILPVKTCPTNCVCHGTSVSCSGAMDLTQTFPNSESIRSTRFINCVINEIPGNTFSLFHSVENFEFQKCDIGIIRESAFDGMTGAREESLPIAALMFYDANIGVIEQGGLSGVRGFSHLKMNGTRISRVKSSAIAYSEFENIQISHTDFIAIEPYVFAYDLLAKYFSMKHVRVPELPERMFAGLEHTEDVLLAHSYLGTIRPRAFLGLTNVTIGITKCVMETLSEDAFNGVRQVEHLTISDSNISTVQGRIFGNLTPNEKRMSYVYISGNTIGYLLNYAFAGLNGFASLYFNGNRINCWEIKALDGILAGDVYQVENTISSHGLFDTQVESCRRYSSNSPVETVSTAPRISATLPATPARVHTSNNAYSSPNQLNNILLSVPLTVIIFTKCVISL